eukprot:5497432-Prymnesium_polylepis.1
MASLAEPYLSLGPRGAWLQSINHLYPVALTVSAPQAQEGPTPRPRCRQSEADLAVCSQAARPAVAFSCGARSSRWLRCFTQSP